ncbi:MAG TPA: histidine phosphatase family protein [Trichocoleus sp.]
MPCLKLLLIRHAESVGNQEGRMEGWQSTPLTAKGRQQASALGQRLLAADWLPTHIYCSPLSRAAETLWELAVEFGWIVRSSQLSDAPHKQKLPLSDLPVPLTWSAHLKEYQNGVFQGLTWAEAQAQYPELCHQLEASSDWLPIPEAESLAAGRARAVQFVEALLATHTNSDRIWVISHHWMLQQVMSVLLGCDRTWGFPIAHTGLFELWLDQQRWQADGINRWNSELWQIKRFNDCQHLQGSL